MTPGQSWFEILLDKPEHKFSPGETMAGRVILNLIRPKKIKSIRVRIKGMAKVNWTESTGSGKAQLNTYYSGEELYFRLDVYVLGQPDSDTIEIDTGSYVFEFSLGLPRNIPSSFETMYGGVRYSVKAILEQTRKFDQVSRLPFTVETPYDVTQPQFEIAMNPILIEESETFCSLGFKRGGLVFNVFLPISAFTIGETIQAKIHINSKAISSRVTKVKLDLEQIIMLHAQSPKKTNPLIKVIQTVKEKRSFGKMDAIDLSMPVPSLPYSDMVNCSIIDVVYYISVTISVSGCHVAANRKYPIVIGTKPVPSVQFLDNPNVIDVTMPTSSPYSVEVPMLMITGPMTTPPPHGAPVSTTILTQSNTSIDSTEKLPPSDNNGN